LLAPAASQLGTLEPVNITVPAFVSLAFESAAMVVLVRSARII